MDVDGDKEIAHVTMKSARTATQAAYDIIRRDGEADHPRAVQAKALTLLQLRAHRIYSSTEESEARAAIARAMREMGLVAA